MFTKANKPIKIFTDVETCTNAIYFITFNRIIEAYSFVYN